MLGETRISLTLRKHEKVGTGLHGLNITYLLLWIEEQFAKERYKKEEHLKVQQQHLDSAKRADTSTIYFVLL